MSTIKTTNLQAPSAASPAIVLAADGSATAQLSSLNGGALSGARNRIINGDMRIDQRNAGASVTATTGFPYTVDRWQCGGSQNSKFTVQQSTTAPSGFVNSALITSSSAYTVGASEYFLFQQPIEGLNVSDLAWGTASAVSVTLSFRVRSSLTGTFGGAINNSANDRSYPFTYTISAANTWETKSVVIPGDTSGTWLTTNGIGIQLRFSLGTGSSVSAAAGSWASGFYASATGATSVVGTNGATFYITGVQLEAGSVATPFERRSYGQELALAMRYFYKHTDVYLVLHKNGFYESQAFYFPVPMRAAPTMSGDTWTLRALNAGTDTGYSGFSYAPNTKSFYVSSSTTANSTFYTWIGATVNANAEL